MKHILIAVCAMLLLGACSSSKSHYKKQRKKGAPCDCPKFNYVPPQKSGNFYWV